MPTIPEILMAQANLTPTLFLKVGKLGPKRHRELPMIMNLLGAFSSALPKSLGQPTLRGPPLGRATVLDQRAGLHQASPVAVP